jgi:simple sugar transport system permease protein
MAKTRTLIQFLQPFFALLLGLTLGLLLTMLSGEDPFFILSVLFKSAFGSWYGFGMTLFYSTPLIFTGLSVAIAFKAGLFNVGGEGQLLLGALAAAAVGALFPNVPWPWAPVLATLAAFFAGALWGAIPGWLRARRGSHEVINTIMLNFVAASIGSYVTRYLLPNPESQNPETRSMGASYLLGHSSIFGDAPLSIAFGLAIACALIYGVLLNRTRVGFELKAVGQNEIAAARAGIQVPRIQIWAMFWAGGLSGLVAVSEVLGNAGRYRHGFSPGYGFIGIAVALLGRNRPWGIVLAGFLFGALHKGAADLDFETEHVTRDLSAILQALIILAVAADGLWDWTRNRRRLGS